MRIIDHKRIDLTNDEWNMYQELLKSYDPKMKPESLFHDLFETDKDGIIIYLKPPKQNYFTMEVFLFLMSIMVHQHLRVMYKRVDESISDVQKTILDIKTDYKEFKLSSAGK